MKHQLTNKLVAFLASFKKVNFYKRFPNIGSETVGGRMIELIRPSAYNYSDFFDKRMTKKHKEFMNRLTILDETLGFAWNYCGDYHDGAITNGVRRKKYTNWSGYFLIWEYTSDSKKERETLLNIKLSLEAQISDLDLIVFSLFGVTMNKDQEDKVKELSAGPKREMTYDKILKFVPQNSLENPKQTKKLH